MDTAIRDIRIDVGRVGLNFDVQETISYVESNVASGRLRTTVTRYERMTRAECLDVLEALAGRLMPGDPMPAFSEPTLF